MVNVAKCCVYLTFCNLNQWLSFIGFSVCIRTLRNTIWIRYGYVLHGDISTVVCHSKDTRGQICQCFSEVALCLWCWCAWRHNTMFTYHTPESTTNQQQPRWWYIDIHYHNLGFLTKEKLKVACIYDAHRTYRSLFKHENIFSKKRALNNHKNQRNGTEIK